MQKTYLTLQFCIFCTFLSFGQKNNKSVLIKGKFENSSYEKIYIKSESFNDSLICDQRGNFHYKTFKITRPIQANLIIGNRIQIFLYLAPGYSLVINANTEKIDSFFKSLQILGIGSKTNLYWKENYFLYKNQLIPMSEKWYDIKKDEFLEEGLGKPNLDSFANEINKNVFGNSNQEPFSDFFKKAASINIKFRKLLYLFAYSTRNDLSVAEIDLLIKKSIHPDLFKTLSLDNYLSDFFYRETIGYFYINHILNKELLNNKEILQNSLKRKLEIVNTIYTGETKNFVLNRLILSGIKETFSFQELEMLKSFIYLISNKFSRKILFEELVNRKREISKVSFGKDAPVFNLPDTLGNKHSLLSFRGKVVYIDLWASWCGPCKEEMPALLKLYNEYKKNENIQIISIAVKDVAGNKNRIDFINKLKLNWLQLEDQEDFIWNKYKVTSIPRFILIDKKGKIINFDAPRPSEKNKIKKALDEAINNDN